MSNVSNSSMSSMSSSTTTSSTSGPLTRTGFSGPTTTTSSGPVRVDSTTTTTTTAGTASTVLPQVTTAEYNSASTTTGMPSSQRTTASAAVLHPVDDATVVSTSERVVEQVVQQQVATINKYVTTQHQTTAVPVAREKAVLEREPLADGQKVPVSSIGEDHVQVPLMAERAVGTKETVPVEKVRLGLGIERVSEKVEVDRESIKEGEYQMDAQGKTLGNAPQVAVNTAPAGVPVHATERL